MMDEGGQQQMVVCAECLIVWDYCLHPRFTFNPNESLFLALTFSIQTFLINEGFDKNTPAKLLENCL